MSVGQSPNSTHNFQCLMSLRSTGDITSLKYNSVEYQGTSKATAINSGLGTSTVTGETVNGYVKITIKSSGLPVTQYLIAKPKESLIYMATYITAEVRRMPSRHLRRTALLIGLTSFRSILGS